jgi:hypothetical protein
LTEEEEDDDDDDDDDDDLFKRSGACDFCAHFVIVSHKSRSG